MLNQADEKAFSLLEKAVDKAQISLQNTKSFQPFMMLLDDDDGEIIFYHHNIENSEKSYAQLEKDLEERMHKKDIDIVVLVMDTVMPKGLSSESSTAIRIHLEEKSQIKHKIGARFIYVPYTLNTVTKGKVYVTLYTPVAVGFPAEYIKMP